VNKRLLSVIFAALWLSGAAAMLVGETMGLPPQGEEAMARLSGSTRHSEWVTVNVPGGDRVDAFVVYPERRDRASVVLVIHEIFGLNDWARAVADQLAAEVVRRLNAVAEYAVRLPTATDRFGVVGFCWGGGMSFLCATEQPDLDAAVIYYGVSPATAALTDVRAPVLGLYGGDDARVNATIPAAEQGNEAPGQAL